MRISWRRLGAGRKKDGMGMGRVAGGRTDMGEEKVMRSLARRSGVLDNHEACLCGKMGDLPLQVSLG